MKRRNRANRRRFLSTRSIAAGLFGRTERKRKSFTFERLEDRLAFSVAPFETTSYSSDTPEGAAAILLREMQWAALQAASANGTLDLSTLSLPTDPYFPNPTDPTQAGQWHLLNNGQQVGNPDFQFIYGAPGEDINVVPAWNLGYTGEGVIVAVLDDGIQSSHPDLWGNMHPDFAFNAFDGTNNGSPFLLIPSHGTAVAGLIGATWSLEEGVPVSGGVGVAPEVTLVPIRMLGNSPTVFGPPGTSAAANAFRYALMIGADITNNSWGGFGVQNGAPRVTSGPTLEELELLRDSVIFGRDGLGMINVFATGNNGGSNQAPFANFGNYSSAAYNGFINSRYTIGVSGIDHDGQYVNSDGTVTAYPMAGPNVLVAAPTGSNLAQNVADDTGQGSGLWTTDLVGDAGYNAAPDLQGIDDDRDFLADTSYTTRFNGTSAAAPLVSGVIALMLDANPNLTFRDVQEILVRSARQAAQFEFPSNGAGVEASFNTYQTNPMLPFRDPDSWDIGVNRFDALYDPIADPTLTSFPYFGGGFLASPDEGNDFERQLGHYELQPAEYTNGVGYTVSQGYGTYGELIGYAHGVIDAELAVIMARDWHTLNQNSPPQTEKTFTTFANPPGIAWNLPAAEESSDETGNLLVPGGIGGLAGFIAFWNEYGAEPPAPFDPANADSWPGNSRGFSYIDFSVPVSQQINVEWVEVKISISGPAVDLDHLKINITSPSGMQSELNHYYQDLDFRPNSLQFLSEPADRWAIQTPGDLSNSDTFVWTFSTNRNWGESTNAAVIINPLTGEPVEGSTDFSGIPQPIFRDWELHIENWSTSQFVLDGVEVVWHGKPIAGGQLDQEWIAQDPDWKIPVAQRIQGFVGIDVDSDDEFSGIDDSDDNEWNNRYIQTFFGDPAAPRQTEMQRRLLDDYQDNNFNGVFDAGDVREQEPFAANVLVEAFEFTVDGGGNDIVDDQPIAQFITGADGNYYFDLLPGNYMIRVTDRSAAPGTPIDDPNTPAGFLQHYKDEWRITEDWFYAPDRDVPTTAGAPGEIFYDAAAQAPVAFQFDASQPRIPMAVQNINFLLKPQDIPPNNVVVSGIVYADVNENGSVDIFDSPAGGMRVYVDSVRNGQFDAGEQWVYSNPDGTYSLTVLAATPSVIAIGVDLEPGWEPSLVGGDVITLFAGPGDVIPNTNFFLNPPDDSTGSGLGNITGFVFSDLDPPGPNGPNGVRDLNEVGLAGVRVFIDAGAMNGVYDVGEVSAITAANGGYFFANVAPGTHRIDVQIDNEGTPAATAQMTTPVAGYHNVTITAGQTQTGIVFGLYNLAGKDYGDLPASYNAGGVPSHILVPHFRLGTTIDGEVAGQASGADDTTDDGVVVLGDGLLHAGANTLQVTVFGVGGFLSGWIDWNNSGTFEESERLNFTDVDTGEVLGTQADLGPGTFNLRIQAPALVDGISAARFRWGEFGINLGSQSFIGEVEDYFLQTSVAIVAPSLPGDFNEDGGVNAADYVLFRKVMGTGASLPNSTNPSGPVVAEDGTLWTNNFAESSTIVTPSLPGDFNDDGGVNAADYVAFRKLMGTGASLPNTTNPAGPVVAADEALWSSNYGETDGGGGGGGGADSQYVEAPPAASTSTPIVALGRGASSGSPSTPAVVSTPQTSSTDSQTADSSTISPFFASLSFDISPAVSFKFVTEDAQTDSATSSEQSNAEILLLLDQALEELDERDDDAPLADRSSEEDGYSDLALAAVFDDNTSWWSL